MMVMFFPMTLFMNLFPVTVGVNHQKTKNNHAGNNQDDDNRLILPYLVNKFGHVRIHVRRSYTPSAKNGSVDRFWQPFLILPSRARLRFELELRL
jgi:hypothetical protein